MKSLNVAVILVILICVLSEQVRSKSTDKKEDATAKLATVEPAKKSLKKKPEPSQKPAPKNGPKQPPSSSPKQGPKQPPSSSPKLGPKQPPSGSKQPSTSLADHMIFTDNTKHSENTGYFNRQYFINVNYDFLNGEKLLTAPKPQICTRETKQFGCKLYKEPLETIEVTYLHATRLAIDYISHEFPIHNLLSMFDWMFFSSGANSDFTMLESKVMWYGQGTHPRTVFVENCLMPYFVANILPNMTSSFVLFSGHNDFTVPYNVDARWDRESVYQAAWDTVIASQKVIHWFNENLIELHPKVSTMPIGMNPREAHPDDFSDHPEEILPLGKRPFQLLQLDKVRTGEQWLKRKIVHDLCLEQPTICFAGGHKNNMPSKNSHKLFAEQVSTYPFLLCVQGGGIDPSPKAWESILLGTIPIIEHTPLDDAYSQLPVAFVNNITEFMMSPKKETLMKNWMTHLSPFYEAGSKKRAEVMYTLTTKYWWGKIVAHLNQTIESYSALKLN